MFALAQKRNRKRRRRVEKEDDFGFPRGGGDGPDDDREAQEEEQPRKKLKINEPQWIPIGTPKNEHFASILREYEAQHCETDGSNLFCFFCRIGENMPHFNKMEVEKITKFIYNGLRTTNMTQHVIHGFEKFEEEIRKPLNAKIKSRREQFIAQGRSVEGLPDLIPEWRPSMIKEHLEEHHTDPELIVEILARNVRDITTDIVNHCLFRKMAIQVPKKPSEKDLQARATAQEEREVMQGPQEERTEAPEAEPEEEFDTIYIMEIDPEKWKIYKEAAELTTKIMRSDPRKMAPFYSKDRFIVEQHAGHPFSDFTSKKIVSLGPTMRDTDANSWKTFRQ